MVTISMLLALASATTASAQEPVDLPTPTFTETGARWSSAEPAIRSSTHVRGRGLRTAGIVTSSIGFTFAALGTGLAISGAIGVGDCEFECMGSAIQMGYGAVSGVIAAPFLIAGGTMWGVGQQRMNKHRLSLAPVITPDQTGLALTVTGF